MYLGVIATKVSIAASSAVIGFYGVVFGQTSITTDTSLIEKTIDGGASVLLLGIAATSMYALLQGRIVPIAAFEKRLEEIEEDLKKINENLLLNGHKATLVKESTDLAHRELKEMLAHANRLLEHRPEP